MIYRLQGPIESFSGRGFLINDEESEILKFGCGNLRLFMKAQEKLTW